MTDWMFSKRPDRPEILCAVSSAMAKAIDGLKPFGWTDYQYLFDLVSRVSNHVRPVKNVYICGEIL